MFPVALPADAWRVTQEEGGSPPPKLSRWAIGAAALAHIAIVALLLFDWKWPFAEARRPEKPIEVALVFQPPPRPPPPPQPKPQPKYAESGPDQKTTAPPPATEVAPEPAAPPPPAPTAAVEPAHEAKAETNLPAPAPVPVPEPQPKPVPSIVRLTPPREAATPQARRPEPPRVTLREPGDELRRGDPYLNELMALLDRNRPPSTPVGAFGLHLEGTPVFYVVVDRSGRVRSIVLERSSGAVLLDEEVEQTILKTAPFPPVPPNYPTPIGISIAMHLAPG